MIARPRLMRPNAYDIIDVMGTASSVRARNDVNFYFDINHLPENQLPETVPVASFILGAVIRRATMARRAIQRGDIHPCFECPLCDCDDNDSRCRLKVAITKYKRAMRLKEPVTDVVRQQYNIAFRELYSEIHNRNTRMPAKS
jgi:hypothetical protein